MALGNLPVLGRPTIWMIVGQGPTALAVGASGCCWEIFTLIYPFSPPSPSLWETARYRLKYCLKGPLNPKQPTSQLVRWDVILHAKCTLCHDTTLRHKTMMIFFTFLFTRFCDAMVLGKLLVP